MLYMLALNINDVINFDYMEQPSLEVSTSDLVGAYTLHLFSDQ